MTGRDYTLLIMPTTIFRRQLDAISSIMSRHSRHTSATSRHHQRRLRLRMSQADRQVCRQPATLGHARPLSAGHRTAAAKCHFIPAPAKTNSLSNDASLLTRLITPVPSMPMSDTMLTSSCLHSYCRMAFAIMRRGFAHDAGVAQRLTAEWHGTSRHACAMPPKAFSLHYAILALAWPVAHADFFVSSRHAISQSRSQHGITAVYFQAAPPPFSPDRRFQKISSYLVLVHFIDSPGSITIPFRQ